MRRLTGLVAALCFVSALLSGAAESPAVDVQVRLFDKRIFYINRQQDIRLKVTIANNGQDLYRFKLADDHIFNFDFEVKTLANVQLPHSKDFNISRTAVQYVYFREIVLQPGEEYSFVVGLARFVNVDRPGVLTVQAVFYPDMLTSNTSTAVRSNVVPINVRPEVMTEKDLQMLDLDTNKVIQREPLPPDQVVEFTIRARQQSQMRRFVLYMDLESLLLSSPERRRRYERSDEEARRELLAQYESDLMEMKDTVDGDILVVPNEFQILNTQYTPFEGRVTVEMKFRYRDYTEVKEYTYYLERREGIWMITNIEVMNVRTE